MSNIDEFLPEIESQNDKQLIKDLTKIIMGMTPKLEMLDILGSISKKDPEFFMNKIYPKVWPMIVKKYHGKMTSRPIWFQSKELSEINEFILTKYCFFEGEKLITRLTGQVYPVNIGGFIYLTNYRIFAIGNPVKSVSTPSFSSRFGINLLEGIVRMSINLHRKILKKNFAKLFHKELISSNLGEWGYSIPIFGATEITKTSKNITYSIIIDNKRIGFKVVARKQNQGLSLIEQQLLTYQQ
ncbi:hypothetical protein LCGC14_1181560 [marine sediment metagenome]|uniref:Uncharacterized protein n=1 Tax=marine sediment metagenome TaxID=412755 RepID=A0A0F9P4V0_9ZZZZ|nr:hypothetical protein [bacterium]